MTSINESTPTNLESKELREKVSLLVRSHLVSFLGFDDLEDVGTNDAFSDLGTDSRQAVEFKMVLETLFDCRLRTTVLFEYPTVDRLVDFIVDEVIDRRIGFQPVSPTNSSIAFQPVTSSELGTRIQTGAETGWKPILQGDSFPLSETQRGLWYISETLDLASSFHVPLLFRLTKPLDPDRFDQTLRAIATHHPILRTCFKLDKHLGEIQQQIVSADRIPATEFLGFVKSQSEKPLFVDKMRESFDLAANPPIRSWYGVDEQGSHFALIVFHHIVMDGLSAVPFVDELWRDYFDLNPNALPTRHPNPNPIYCKPDERIDDGFFRYLDWEKEYLTGESANQDFAFWKNQLKDVDGNIGLVRVSGTNSSGVGCRKHFIAPELFDRLQGFAHRMHSPISSVLLAAYFVLLSRLSGRSDLAITSPVSGRPGGQRGPYQNCFGSFINLIITRCKLDPLDSFEIFLHDVREKFLEGVEHGQLPFARQLIAAEKRLASGNEGPFPISFTYQNIFEAWGENPSWQQHATLDFSLYQEIDDLLTLEVYDFRNSLQINWKYNESAFSSASIESWAESFQYLLSQILDDPTKRLCELGLCSPNQRLLVQSLFDNRLSIGNRSSEIPQNVVQRIDQTAASYPDDIAVVQGALHWSYRHLIDSSKLYEKELLREGVGPGTLVRIEAVRTPETIAKILGVLRLGAAYLPIDPNGPALRTNQILEDAGDQVELGTAYVLYTSGTTGIPKGVPIQQSSLLNLCDAMIDRYGLTAEDRVLQFASLTFDMSIEEIFPILCVGGTLVLREEEDLDPHRFTNLIHKHKVSIANIPPSYHQALSTLGEKTRTNLYSQLRLVSFGGDSLTQQTLSEVQTSRTRIFNAYGPTETSVNATLAELTDSNVIHIGGPLPGVSVQVVDNTMQMLPLYVPGELCISGVGVSRGYLGHAKNSDKFVDTATDTNRDRFYRTGDQAYLTEDGFVYLMGRVDDQINLRGHRIEPGEIESAIACCENIYEAAVVLARDRIVAFYRSSNPIDEQELRLRLRVRLPSTMIPSVWIARESLPINDRGKIDRKQLVLIAEKDIQQECGYTKSERFDERADLHRSSHSTWPTIRAILCSLLEYSESDSSQIRLDDNFFDLGGHSLLAIQVVARLNLAFQIQISLREFLAAASFQELLHKIDDSIAIDRANEQNEANSPTVLQDASSNEQVSTGAEPGVLSPSQARLWFLDRLGESKAYKIPAMAEVFGDLNIDRLRYAAVQISKRHASLRTRFVSHQGKPIQIVTDEIDIPFFLEKFTTHEEALHWINVQAAKELDLENGPLLHIAVAEIARETLDSPNAILLVCMHHIISDGWSMQVWIREFKHFFENATIDGDGNYLCDSLPSLPLQYTDYACRQSARNINQKGLDYWKRQLDGFQEIDLHTDFPRAELLSNQGGVVTRNVHATLNTSIKEFCRLLKVTPSPFWLSALFGTLRKRGCGDDLCFGIPVAGRSSPDLEQLIGFFVNTMILRLQFPFESDVEALPNDLRDPVSTKQTITVTSFVKHVSNLFAEGLEHQDIPIEDVFGQLEIERSPDRSPVFQVLFSYAAVPIEPILLQSRHHSTCLLKPILPVNETAKFELTVTIQERADGSAMLAIEYASSLFHASTIKAMLDQLLHVVERMIETHESDRCFSSCTLLASSASTNCDVNKTNQPEIPRPMPFINALQQVASSLPNQLAIEEDRGNEWCCKITYAELWKRAFPLLSKSSPEPIALATGSTSPTLDAAQSEGSGYDSVVEIAILDAKRGAELICRCVEALAAKRPFTFYEEYSDADLSNHIAYVLSTSGSSGQAKGVAISQLAMDNHNAAFIELFQVSHLDRIAQYATPTFDLFIEEVFPALRVGATIVIVPEAIRLNLKKLVEWIIEKQITILDLPTAVFHALITEGSLLSQEFHHVRLVIVGGEALSRTAASAFLRRHSSIQLWNTYGPTEATVICAVHRVLLEDLELDPPIGKPFANSELQVVDPDGYPVPDGVPGELVIAGPCLAEGYVSTTNRRIGFQPVTAHQVTTHQAPSQPVATPLIAGGEQAGNLSYGAGFRNYSSDPRRRAYWTGDYVRIDERGNLRFLGRLDDQIKIRGHRVEPSEVANLIKSNSSVRNAVVVVDNVSKTVNSMNAYLIAAVETDASLKRIRDELVSTIPLAMWPAQWIALKRLPVTLRGKIDRREIVRIAQSERVSEENQIGFELNETDSQKRMRKIWNRLLGHNRFSVDDDFFHVGGHSLLAAQWIYEIEANFNQQTAIIDAFRYPSIRRMVDHLESLTVAFNNLHAVASSLWNDSLWKKFSSKVDSATKWTVILPGLPGLGELYRPLAETICETDDVLVLTMPGYGSQESENAVPVKSIEEVAARWFDVLQSILDGRPVDWIAHSYSGTILFELLRTFGDRLPVPQRVVLLDCWPHEPMAMATDTTPTYKSTNTSTTVKTRPETLPSAALSGASGYGSGIYVAERLRSLAIDSIPGAEQVIRNAMSAAPILPAQPLDIPVTLAIAQSSRDWLDATQWTSFFRSIETRLIEGDHFSIARQPDCFGWLDLIRTFSESLPLHPDSNLPDSNSYPIGIKHVQ